MARKIQFFDKTLRVFGAPSRYLQGANAIAWLGPIVSELGDRALIVLDAVIKDFLSERLSAELSKSGIEPVFLNFSGDLNHNTASELSARIDRASGDVILACGGGRAIDTGKALAEILDVPIITMPTAASTDAPTSKNFVIYDDNHRLVEVRNLTRNPDFVLVDTQILLSAPKALFVAGIGDALAKHSEARACSLANGQNMFRSRPPRTALAIALECYETLMESGIEAYNSVEQGKLSSAFEDVVEATILMAGLGFENGGLSVAHALTRGLSCLPQTIKTPHGFQVAYGLMVQIELEGAKPDLRLLKLMHHIGLPMTLKELSGMDASEADYKIIAEGSADASHLLNFPGSVTVEAMIDAMRAIEDRASNKGHGALRLGER